MHILLVCTARGVPLYGRSGASAHLRGLAGAMVRAGHRVTAIVANLGTPAAHAPLPIDVRTLPVPRWRRRRRSREGQETRHAASLMAQAPAGVDLVWHRHALHDGAVPDWCRRHHVPRWLELNAPLTLERDLLDPLGARARARRAEAASVRRADRVFAVSRWLLPWARALGAERVHWLPNGTSLPAHDPSRRRRVRTALGLEGLVLGHVGSCRPWHRVERMPALLDALPGATGLLVGDGPVKPQHPRLRQLGFRADPRDIADAVSAMDVGLVLGGLPWVHPLKHVDYRSQGTPVLSVPVGDTPSLAETSEGRVLPWSASWPSEAAALATKPRRHEHRSWDDVLRDAFRAGLSG